MIPPFPHLPGYTLDSLIGRGAFGTVFQARWDGSYVCALKVLEKGGAPHLPYLGTVLEKLRELPEHPGLLQVYAFDLAGAMPHLSMALLPENAATADQLSGQVTEDEAWGLLRQLSDTLAWMHGHGLAHAGLTAGNVVVVGTERGVPQVMVTDAGQAWLGDGPMNHLHDQAACLPPERWREPGRLLREGRGESWDVYAFGIIAWRLLTGDWPRGADVFETVLTSRSEGLSIDPPAFAEWLSREPAPRWPTRALHSWEKSCREIVLRCLELDPAKRPESMMEVALVLRKAPALKKPLGAAEGSEAEAGIAGGSLAESGRQDSKPQDFEPPESVEVVDWLGVEEWPSAPASWETAANLPAAPAKAVPSLAPEQLPEAVSEPEVVTISELLPRPPAPKADPQPEPEALTISAFPPPPARLKPAPATASPPAPNPATLPVAVRSVETVHPVHKVHPAPQPAAPPASAPAAPPQPPPAKKPPASRRWLVEAVAATLMLAAALYALNLKTAGDRSRAALGQAGAAAQDAEKRAADSAAQAATLKKRVEEQRVREMTALRDSSAATVAKMLESAPADPAERGVWKAAAAPVAEQLRQTLEVCDAIPSLTASSMEARSRLADLHIVMEKPDAARPLLDRLAADLEKASPEPGDAAQENTMRLLKAQTAARRGAIHQDAGQTAEALPLLSLASAAFEQWLPQHPDRADVARTFAENALREGRALRESKKPAEAKAALTRVTALLPKPNAPDFPADAAAFTLADAFAGLAELSEAEGQLQDAIGFRTGLVQALLTYDAKHPKSVPCRTRMTESLLTMGQNLSALGAQQDALQTLQRAVKLLSELSAESPDNPVFNLQTARAYSEVAQVLQAADPTPAGAKSALDYAQGAETILRRLTQASPDEDSLKLRLASTLVLKGELRAAAGDSPGDLLAGLDESVTLATQLNLGTTLDDARRAECRKIGARAWAVIGGVLEKAGKKTEAAASYGKALEVWSALAATDPAARRLETTTRERLKKLQPGG